VTTPVLYFGTVPATLVGVTLRITLGEDTAEGRPTRRPATVREPGAATADFGDPGAPPLLLYLADEPEIGREFEYGGARWEIVDYQDGWIARLVVAQ